MTKHFCDRCGKEAKRRMTVTVLMALMSREDMEEIGFKEGFPNEYYMELCSDCMTETVNLLAEKETSLRIKHRQ